MKKYSIGTKGARSITRWHPQSKIKWVMARAAFIKHNGLLLSKWW